MFKEVIFLSAEKMHLFKPSADVVVVSILDKSEEKDRPTLQGFRDVLRLQFEDTYEELKLVEKGGWPDEPTDEEHARFAQGRGERVPTLSNAREIVEFLDKHHQTFDHLTLVAHCHGGISRSAAVASWAATRYWAPINCMMSTDWANPRLMRLMNKAAGRY
jgi:predicted protein tyrosine phosphatase